MWRAAGLGLRPACCTRRAAAIVYGRTIWNPDLAPLCAAVALWGMVELWQCDSDWGQAAALFAIGCAAQLHPQATALLVVWLALTLAKRRLRWPSLLALGGLALVLSPYVYLQATSGWSDVRAALAYLQQPKQVDDQALAAFAELFSSFPYGDALAPRGLTGPHPLTDPLHWFYGLTVLGGLVLAFRRRGAALVAAGCFVAPLLAALDHAGSVEPHYLLVVLPSGCLLIALALGALRPRPAGTVVPAAGPNAPLPAARRSTAAGADVTGRARVDGRRRRPSGRAGSTVADADVRAVAGSTAAGADVRAAPGSTVAGADQRPCAGSTAAGADVRAASTVAGADVRPARGSTVSGAAVPAASGSTVAGADPAATPESTIAGADVRAAPGSTAAGADVRAASTVAGADFSGRARVDGRRR